MKHIAKKVLIGLPDYALRAIYLNADEAYDRKTVKQSADIVDERIKNEERL